ncbi:MAG: PEP-CTERM sorting domain-containing protein [Crocosphaera sp.]|nr:PEP-CTERM sorting domain-containing protein [Crocosphaera sp.]
MAGIHDDVAPNGIEEHITFVEDGDDHGHGGHGGGEMPPGQDPVSVPEPSVLGMLATSGLLGLASGLKR